MYGTEHGCGLGVFVVQGKRAKDTDWRVLSGHNTRAEAETAKMTYEARSCYEDAFRVVKPEVKDGW